MLKDKVLSLKKYWKSGLSEGDLEALVTLLESDIALADAFSLLETKANKPIFDAITTRLKTGEPIDKVFVDFLDKRYISTFKAFISYLSLQKTLTLMMEVDKREADFLRSIGKDLMYPLALLVFSIVGIYLFNGYCFEPLLNSMSQFSSDITGIYVFRTVLDIVITVIFVLLLIAGSLFLYFIRPKRMVLAYVLLQRYWSTSILKEYLTSRFVLFFAECYKIGLKTKDSIDILKNLRARPLVAFLANTIDKGLLQGDTMTQAMQTPYLDEKIARFIKIAQYSGAMGPMLESYMTQFQMRFTNFCKRLAKAIQTLSYGMIGLVIIFIYQILFIPMGVLGGL